MSNNLLPPRYCRSYSAYRTFENAGMISFVCCGLARKAGVTIDTIDRVHRFYTIVYVLRGRGTYIDGKGIKYPVEAGMALQRVPWAKHSLLIDPDSDWCEGHIGIGTVRFRNPKTKADVLKTQKWPWWESGVFGEPVIVSLLRLTGLYIPERPVWKVGVRLDLAEAFLQMIDSIKNATHSELPAQILPALNLIRMIQTADKSAPKPRSFGADIICRIIAMIAADPASRKPAQELLRDIPLSYSRIRTLFKRETGISMETYRIQRRVEEACRLLAEEGFSPTQTADTLHYNDYFAFSRQFKLITGISPKHFKRSMAGTVQPAGH